MPMPWRTLETATAPARARAPVAWRGAGLHALL